MKKKSYLGLYFFLFSSFLSSCSYTSQGIFIAENRYAVPEATDHFGDSAKKIVYTDQNWDGSDSLWFYNTSQGSNMIPYDIFIHLEQSDSTELFRSDENMRKYRYLPQSETWDNEDGLPLGFVRDEYRGKAYVGLTCAACHTNQINYNGVGIRIDGAPALADIGSMLVDLGAAIQATEDNEGKFQRLAKQVLDSDDPKSIEDFRRELKTVTQNFNDYNRRNTPLHNGEFSPYGYARLDAFGRIFNRTLGHLTPGKDNYVSPNAPVSYPFLWDTPQHDFVQWNGIAKNTTLGPLGRNTGEVLGVFASFDLDKKKGDIGYRSSALNRNQMRLERHIRKMISPLWQDLAEKEVLPEIDSDKALIGKAVFEAYKCVLCHQEIDRKDPDRLVIAQFTSLKRIGTDTFMARNSITTSGKSGFFKGKNKEWFSKKAGQFGDKALAADALGRALTGVLLEPDHDKWFIRRWSEKIYDLVAEFFDNPVKVANRQFDFETVGDEPEFLLAYKGRPLNGIWATAPYLHNGSVPNLYELFLPSCRSEKMIPGKECRSQTFTLGSREFDPEKVGFVSKDKQKYPGLFVFDTSKPGNSNRGHEYVSGHTSMIKVDEDKKPIRGADGAFLMESLSPITETEREALVEYLKTL